MYNIRSAEWSAQYFNLNHKFAHARSHASGDPDRGTPGLTSSIQSKRVEPNAGDKFLCDVCSLQDTCKYFRVGAICSVPGTEAHDLARFFKTRDAETIIDGLGNLLAVETKRLEKALADEEMDDKIDPQVTKIINTLFDRGVKLAKLLNPSLVQPKVSLSFTNNTATIQASSASSMMAAVVKELEAQGVPRDKITPEMVEAVLSASSGPDSRAIDVASSERAG